ncbi:ABC transporter permease [Bacillus sp. HMF5848]|uniref:ABC transporter permease n=1 Tax=Bacillus sp. HMF5848 TaxID=2495421 RepID=UPI000F779CBB|nr:ABC transporter permease [Bacillus sp. HMF5848]RSK27975.1 ABC transporter permease [Bacillus sp. HMF5848]
MSSLLKLIQNENMKLYRRIGTWIMIGLLVIITVAGGVITKYVNEGNENPNWQQTLIEENKRLTSQLQEPIPDQLKRQYEQTIAKNEYSIEHDIAPVPTASFWGYVRSSIQIIPFVTMFTVIIAAGSIASEFSWGTIKLLLIRPASRGKLLLSKYIATLLFAISLLAILLVVAMITSLALYGIDNLSTPHLSYVNGSVAETSMLAYVLSNYGLNSIQLVMMVTFAFMISSVFRSNSLAIGLAIFLMFTGAQFTMLLAMKFEWAKYILFANLDLTQYINGMPPVQGMTMTFSIVMLIIYFVLFNALSWFVFTKRDVAA